MPDRLIRSVIACAALLALGAAPAHAARMLADSTSVDGWTLENGLRVVVRQVPGAGADVVVVAYPAGRDDDPEGEEGFTELMAEAAFMAQSGEIPARSRADLDSQRPVGWNVQVERRRTELAEMATPDQFPGVLHQVALRMRGVDLTDEVVARARTALAERRAQTVGADLGAELYVEAGQMAAGWDHARFERWMSGAGLAKLRARDLAPRIAESYVPARAVLSLAGDFRGIDLRTFIENEFGDIPAGTPRADVMPPPAQSPVSAVVKHPGLDLPVGCIGIAAPALTDSLHPSFFLTALILGAHATRLWSGTGVVRSHFQYSILDDPSLVRLYPPIVAANWKPENMQQQLGALITTFASLTIALDQAEHMKTAVAWLLGGPLPGPLLARVRTDHAVLYRVCSNAATRELWGGEAFWEVYRRRFDPARSAGDERWPAYMKDPARAIGLIYAP